MNKFSNNSNNFDEYNKNDNNKEKINLETEDIQRDLNGYDEPRIPYGPRTVDYGAGDLSIGPRAVAMQGMYEPTDGKNHGRYEEFSDNDNVSFKNDNQNINKEPDGPNDSRVTYGEYDYKREDINKL